MNQKKSNIIQYDLNLDDISNDKLIELYKIMLRIRKLQLKIEVEYPKDEMKTPVHLCIGQEAIPAGVCINLNKDDYLISNYRGHGHYIAKGGNLEALVAELYCKETGCSKGRGGSMHLIDTSVGLLGSTSIVGGGVPIATGLALAINMRNTSQVSVVFFGDGAVDEGALYESINFAVLKKLPVIYMCENNFYAVCSHQSKRQALDNIYQRFIGCGIPGYRVDGNNVIDVYRTAKKVIEDTRNKKGPSLIEFRTYRWCGHSGDGSDTELGYRTQEELDEWKEKCSVSNFQKMLSERNIITQDEIESLKKNVDKEITEAFEFAKASSLPKPEEITQHVFKY